LPDTLALLESRCKVSTGADDRVSSFATAKWAPSETLASPVNAVLSSSATGTGLTHDIAARTGD
jgi:hypothetical protein